MNVLITGAEGQLGRELDRALAPLGTVQAFGRATLDVADEDAVRRVVRDVAPDVIVNAAAYTAVDRAEAEAERAFAVNARGAAYLAEEARARDALLVHFSTDYVFDGERAGAYREEDAPRPLSVYGASKRAGEIAVLERAPRHLVLRTSWVYAAHGRNFVRTILRLARERPSGEPLRIVDDQRGAPTCARPLALATADAIRASLSRGTSGLFHLTAQGETTWYELARTVLSLAGIRRDVLPISSDAFGAPARRPRNSVLDGEKAKRELGVSLAPWRHALEACLRDGAALVI